MKTRRDFILNTAYAGLGVSLIPTLQAAPANSNAAKHIIYLYLAGGMSHLDTFDPKLDPETKGEFTAIKTNVDGMQISEHLPLLAKHGDKMAIVRGMTVTTGDHAGAQYLARTSFKKINTIVHPAMGAWMCHFHDDGEVHALPRNVLIGGPADHPGSGWMPKKFSPVPIQDPIRGLDNSKLKDPADFNKRIAILQRMNRETNKINNPTVKGYVEFYDQTVRLLNSKDLECFDITKESADIRTKYGDNRFGQGCLLARRLIEKAGTKFIEVTSGGWDTHVNNFQALTTQLGVMDQALSALIEDLQASGLLKETLIVLATDFGRTPQININNGRDHFPKAFSNVLIGAGIRGGQVYGSTNAKGTEIADRQVSVPEFNATIAAAAGLPIDQIVISGEGRPFTVANKALPVKDLLA